MVKISAVIPAELARSLERRAREEDRSRGAVVRLALAAHLSRSGFLLTDKSPEAAVDHDEEEA